MAYIRKPAPDGPLISAEQARRRNAEMRLELASLAAEHAHLAPKIDTMRREITAARKKLTRQIRDLATVRAQTEHFAAAVAAKQAALDEAKATRDEPEKVKPKTRPGRKLTHGKRSMYETGCDCDECLGWRRNKTAAEKARAGAKRGMAA